VILGAGTPTLRQDHLEDDAHRPPKHSWTRLRRHAERGQSQKQSLGEQGIQHGVRRQLKYDERGDDRSSVQRLEDLEEQFAKITGGLLLRLARPGDAGQRLLGDRARDGSNAAFEMEMNRGRADPPSLASLRRLNSLAPMLSISLAAAATIAGLVRPARVPAFRFSLTYGLEVFFLGMMMVATMTLAMRRERGRPKRIGRPAHYFNRTTIYPIKPRPVRLERASHANARGHPSRRRSLPRPCGPVLRL
jgi:hypothetical protein